MELEWEPGAALVGKKAAAALAKMNKSRAPDDFYTSAAALRGGSI